MAGRPRWSRDLRGIELADGEFEGGNEVREGGIGGPDPAAPLAAVAESASERYRPVH
jgi:hypothetical protein